MPIECIEYADGDKVIFVNDYGVCWGVKTILKSEMDSVRGLIYYVEDSACPWYGSRPHNFRPADAEDLSKETTNLDFTWKYFQDKYGFKPEN